MKRELARKLRKILTPQEKIIWEHLRNRKLNGKKFLRQYPIVVNFENKEKLFIADFYCAEIKLVIEIDGKIHHNRKEYDNFREYLLSLKGLNVIRFTNDEVENEIDNVLEKIKSLFLK